MVEKKQQKSNELQTEEKLNINFEGDTKKMISYLHLKCANNNVPNTVAYNKYLIKRSMVSIQLPIQGSSNRSTTLSFGQKRRSRFCHHVTCDWQQFVIP